MQSLIGNQIAIIKKRDHPSSIKKGLRRQDKFLPLQMSACVCEDMGILLAITWLSIGYGSETVQVPF